MADTFDVEVPDIGTFTFRKRTYRMQMKIEGEASRLLGGPVNDEWLRAGAEAFATLTVLTANAPPGWNIEAIDPLDPNEGTTRLLKVFNALREEELRFRQGAA
jgi:hypothetical protein